MLNHCTTTDKPVENMSNLFLALLTGNQTWRCIRLRHPFGVPRKMDDATKIGSQSI